MKKERIKLKIIPKPKPTTRTVYKSKVLPLVKGKGNVDLLCGNCKAVLVDGMNHSQIVNIVVQCPACKFYNEIPLRW